MRSDYIIRAHKILCASVERVVVDAADLDEQEQGARRDLPLQGRVEATFRDHPGAVGRVEEAFDHDRMRVRDQPTHGLVTNLGVPDDVLGAVVADAVDDDGERTAQPFGLLQLMCRV